MGFRPLILWESVFNPFLILNSGKKITRRQKSSKFRFEHWFISKRLCKNVIKDGRAAYPDETFKNPDT